MSLVESLIGAIPMEEGAALVARVGERATITARSGSAEVGSVALTVEAMDDLIAQVLPPDQLESLHENGTVHFEFTPRVIGGEFAVLAASTPGDRWLEIRRRNTKTATAPKVAVPAAVPAPPPAQVAPPPSVADDAEVANLLSRFQSHEATAPVPDFDLPAPSAATDSLLPPSFTSPPPAVATDFDLSAAVPVREASPEPSPAPAPVMAVPDASANDDLTLPANLDFPAAKADFDLDGLSLPDALPDRTVVEGFQPEAAAADSDHIHVSEPEAIGMAKSHRPTSTATRPARSRSVVLLSVVLGTVVLGAGGWFAAQWYLTPAVTVAAPPPPRMPAAAATTPAAKPGTNAVVQKPAASSPAPKSVAPVAGAPASKTAAQPAVARATPPPPVPPASTPAAAAKTVTPAPPVTHEGFAIQVAAVHEREEADRIVARLVSEGYSGYSIRGEGAAASYYRVRVPAKDRREAEEIAARLERAEGVKPWIVRETP